MTAIFAGILGRAIALIEEETAGLRAGHALDHQAYAARKSMLLLELERLGRTLAAAGSDAAVQRQLALLRARLEENRALLDVHIAAARDIVAMLAELMRAAESDGTYSAVHVRGRPR